MNKSDVSLSEEALTELLKKATENLYYASEIDAEIVPFIGQQTAKVTKEEILRQAGKSFDEKIEEKEFNQIFERLTGIEDWYGEEEKTNAEKFSALKKLLSENLKDLKVFKVGQIELDVYFIGLDEHGRLRGVQTKAVET